MGNALYRKSGGNLVRVRNLRHKTSVLISTDHAYQFESSDLNGGKNDSIGNNDIVSDLTGKFVTGIAGEGIRTSTSISITSGINNVLAVSGWIKSPYRVACILRAYGGYVYVFYYKIIVTNGASYKEFTITENFYDGGWHHLLVQIENGDVVVYADTARYDTPTYSSGVSMSNLGLFCYFSEAETCSYDQIRVKTSGIYTSSEILALYNERTPFSGNETSVPSLVRDKAVFVNDSVTLQRINT